MTVDEEYDAVVVGARIAGSTVASLLGDAGHRVLLVDRARFPSPTISTHFFRGELMVAVLERLDVLDAVLEHGPPRLTRRYVYTDGEPEPTVEPPQRPGDVGHSLSVRRETLDHVLVERARRSGTVTLAEGTRVTGLLRDDSRVVGARLEGAYGERSVGARIVVGADGHNSFVAPAVDAGTVESTPGFRALYYRYVRDFPPPVGDEPDGAEFSFLGDQVAYVFPSDDGVTCVAVSFNLDDFEQVKRTRGFVDGFEEHVARHRGIADRYFGASPRGKVLGRAPVENYVRVPAGPGWALVGDAGIHQDPWSGFGIDVASRCGEFLAEAICDWFAGTSTEDEAMERYRRRRDELALPIYRETIDLGRDLSWRSEG